MHRLMYMILLIAEMRFLFLVLLGSLYVYAAGSVFALIVDLQILACAGGSTRFDGPLGNR